MQLPEEAVLDCGEWSEEGGIVSTLFEDGACGEVEEADLCLIAFASFVGNERKLDAIDWAIMNVKIRKIKAKTTILIQKWQFKFAYLG